MAVKVMGQAQLPSLPQSQPIRFQGCQSALDTTGRRYRVWGGGQAETVCLPFRLVGGELRALRASLEQDAMQSVSPTESRQCPPP